MSRRRFLLAFPLGFVALLAAAVAVLVASEWGSRRVADALVSLSDGRLRFASLAGTWWRGVEIEDLRLVLPAAEITAERVAVRWRPLALGRRTLHVTSADLAGLVIRPQPDPEPSATPPRLPAPPLRILIDRLTVRDARLAEGQAAAPALDSLTTALRYDADGLALEALALRAGPHALQADLALSTDEPPVLRGQARYEAGAGATPVALDLRFAGPLDALAITLGLDEPLPARVAGELDLLASPIAFALAGDADPAAMLAARGTPIRVTGLQFTAEGTLDAARLEASAELSAAGSPAVALTLRLSPERSAPAGLTAGFAWKAVAAEPWHGLEHAGGAGRLAWEDGRLTVRHELEAPFASGLDLELALGADSPALAARGDWRDLALALDGGRLESSRGRFTAEGPLAELAIGLEAQLETLPAARQPGPVGLAVTGTLRPDALESAALALDVLDGRLTLDGGASWRDVPRVAFDFRAAGLDLARLRPGLDTRLDGAGRVTAELAGEAIAGEVDITALAGAWRGQPIEGRGRVRLAPGHAELEAVRLAIGANRLEAAGMVGERLALSVHLSAPDLAILDPALDGAVQGTLDVAGTRAAPVVEGRLEASTLGFGQHRARGIVADLELALAEATSRSDVALTATDVVLGGESFGALELRAEGPPDALRLTVDLGAAPRELHAALRARWVDGAVDGSIEALRFTLPELGTWAARAPAAYAFRDGAVTLGELCVAQDDASVCASLHDWAATAGRAGISASRLPARLLESRLPAHVTAAGELDGTLSVRRAAGGLEADGSVRGSGLVLGAAPPDGQRIALPIKPLALDLAHRPGEQRFSLTAQIPGHAGLAAEGTLTAEAPRTIAAEITLDATDLRWLGEVVPALRGSRGAFALAGRVSGALPRPEVRVDGALRDGALEIAALGVALEALELEATTGATGEVAVSLVTGVGGDRLTVEGTIEPVPAQGFPFRLRLQSSGVALVRRPDLDLDVAPDLTLSGTTRDVAVRGTLALPRLVIRVPSLPQSAIAVSEDEVVVDASGEVVESEPREAGGLGFYRDAVTGEVAVSLGETASVAGLGFAAELAGGIRIAKQRGNLGLAEGVVRIERGGYEAYGQDLRIQRGTLTFAGPIDNPALNIRAVRPNIDVTAGVLITGTARAPRIELFSAPSMSDVDMLSYIVTGRPLAGATAADGSLLARAALGLGIEHSAILSNKLRTAFGLDQLALDAGSTVDDTTLVAGKQLTSQLSARSEFNVFDHLWSVFLRYRLNDAWSIEAESGARQGADLIYTIEREHLF